MLSPVRSVHTVLHGAVVGVATRALEAQRQLTEWQLAQARFVERQVNGWFELHRVGLQASLRFSEAATRTLVGPRADVAHTTGASAG